MSLLCWEDVPTSRVHWEGSLPEPLVPCEAGRPGDRLCKQGNAPHGGSFPAWSLVPVRPHLPEATATACFALCFRCLWSHPWDLQEARLWPHTDTGVTDHGVFYLGLHPDAGPDMDGHGRPCLGRATLRPSFLFRS